MARGIGRPMAVLVLSDEERSYLERQARRRRVARSISDRCRMILRCADGLTNKAVAAEIGVHEHTVGKWRRRFLKARIEGLSDEPRPGRPRTLTDDQVAKVVERTLSATPADATHWSLRSMAKESGPFAHDDLAHLGRLRLAAAPLGDVQAVGRSALRRQGPRHHRPLSVATGPARWCSVSTRRVRSRRSTVHSRSCRCCRACLSGARTITSATERPRCSQPSMSLPASSSASATGATGPGSFSTS